MRIATAKRYSSRRLKKLVHDTLTNWKSSLLLFHHEITHIEGVTPTGSTVSLAQSAGLLWGKVRSAVQAAVTAVMQHVAVQLEHYALLPSAIDRLQLLHEQLWRHKVTLLVVSLVWAGLGRLLQR